MSRTVKHDIGVIGGGAWGTTLASILAQSGHEVLLWAYEDEVVEEIGSTHRNTIYLPDIDLPEILDATVEISDFENIERLIIVVPSAFYKNVVAQLAQYIHTDTRILSATKGFVGDDLERPSERLQKTLPDNPIGVLSGPNLAREIIQGFPAISLVASKHENLIHEFQNLFSTERFRVYGGNDVAGTELGGALKNVMAIAAGLVDGLGLGMNSHAALITRGLAEMIRLGSKLGAVERTFFGVSGLGDLVCTSQSSLSRNHELGRKIAAGEKPGEILATMKSVAEGVYTTKHVHAFCENHNLDLPITRAVYRVLFEDADPLDAVTELMTRSLKME